jgi:hypothetical protein
MHGYGGILRILLCLKGKISVFPHLSPIDGEKYSHYGKILDVLVKLIFR